MCHWSKGLQIRYNVAQLEQWARDAKVAKTQDSDKEETLEALHPIIQAAVLLQVQFFTSFNIIQINYIFVKKSLILFF